MEQRAFRDCVAMLVDHLAPGTLSEPMPGIQYTTDGLLFLSLTEGLAARVGFGIASGLTASQELLSLVTDFNKLNQVGHVWLAPGADEHNWSLVCGFKFVFSWHERDDLIGALATVVSGHAALRDMCWSKVSAFGGQPYWNAGPDDAGAHALVLMSHLG